MLLLSLHTFSLTGGIERMAKVLTKICNDAHKNGALKQFHAMALYDNKKEFDHSYCDEVSFQAFNGNKVRFICNLLFQAQKNDTILLTHVNLLFPALLSRLFSNNKRIILLAHGIEVWNRLSWWKRKWINKYAEIWAVSTYTATQLANINRINPTKVKVLNNCLDPFFKVPLDFEKPQYLLDRYQLNDNQPVLLTINRLSFAEQYKGYEQVITALIDTKKIFPNIRYLIAGKADPQELDRLQKLILQAQLENHIHFIDFINEDELSDHLLVADLFVMPSKKEGFGLVFIEAAACGCRSVAGNQDGSADALLDGQLGQLVNPDDIYEISQAIILSLNNGNINKRSIQSTCLENFSYQIYKQKVLDALAP